MALIYGLASFLLIISGATRSVAIMPSPTNPNPCCDGTGPKSPNAPLLPVGQGAPVIDVPNGYDFGGPPLPPPNFLQMRPPLLPFVGRDISARSPPSGSGVAITFGPSSVGTGKSPGGPKSNGPDKGYSVIDDAKSAPAGRRSINSRVLLQGGSGSRMMRERGPPSGANDKKNLICVNGLGPGCGAPVINGDSSSGKGKKIDDKGKLPDIGASGGKGNDPSNFCINGLGPGCGVEVIDGNTGIPSGGKSGQNGIMDKNAAASDKKGTASKPGPTSNKNGFGPGPDMGGIDLGPDMGGMGPGPNMGDMGSGPDVGGMGPGPDMDGMGPGPDMGGMGPGPDMGGMGPGPDMGGMGPGPDMGGLGPGPDMGGMGPGLDMGGKGSGLDMSGMGPEPDMVGMGPGPDMGGKGSGPDMSGMGPGPGMGGMGPGPDMGGMGPGPGMGGMGPEPDMGGMGPGPDMGSKGSGPDMGGMGPGPAMGGMGPGPDMGGMGPGPDMGGMGPGPDMGGMGPGPDMGGKGSGPDMGGMGPGPDMGGMGPGPDMGGMGPGPDMGGMGPGPDIGGMGPGPDMGGMGPGPDMGGMGPGQDMGGMGPIPDMGGMGPGPDMGGKGSGPDMGGMGPGPDMGGMGPGPDMGGMGPGQDMGGMGPIPDMGGMGPGPDMGGMGPGPDMGGMGPGPDMGGMGPGSDMGGMGPGPDMSVMGPGPGMGGMGPGPDMSGMEPAPDMGSMGPGPDMGGMGLGPEIGGMGSGPDMGGMGPGPNNGGTGPGPDVGGMGPGPDMGGMGSGPDMGGIGQGPDMGGVGPGAGMGGMGLGPSGSSSGSIGTAGIGLGGQMGIEVEIKSPEIEPRQAPEVKMPEIEMKQRPEIKTPEIKIPEINTPEIKTPEIEPIQAIEIKVPEIEPQQGPEIEGPGFLPGSVGVPMANGVGAGMQINGVSNVPGPSIDGGMSIDSGTLGMQANGVPDALAGGGLPVDSGSVGFKINGGPNVQVPSKGVSVQMQSIGTGVLLNGGGGPSDNQYGGMVVGNGGMGFQINGGSDVPGASVGGVNGNGGVANNLQQMNGNINNQGSKSGMSGSSGASLPIFGSPVDTGSGGYNKMMSGSVDPPGFLANGLDKPSDGNLGMLSPNKMNKPPSWLTDGFGDGSSGSGGGGGMDGGSGGSTGDNQIKVSTGKVDGNKGSSSINIEVKKDAEVTLNIDQGGSKCVCPPQITSTASPQMIKAGASIAKMSNKNVLIAKIPTAKLGGNTMFPNVEIPNLVIEPVSDNSYSSSSPGMTSSEFSLDSSGASSDVLVVAALPGDLGTSGKVNVKVATDPMTGNLVIETTPSPMTGKGLGSSGAGSSSQGSSLGSVGCINGLGPNCGVPIVDGSTTGSGNDKVDDSGKSFGIDLGMSLGDVGSSIIDSSSSISGGAAGPGSNVGGQSASLGGTGPVVGPGDAGGPDLSAGGPDLSAGGPAPGKSVVRPSSDASFGVPAPALAAAGLIPGQSAGGPATGKSAGAGPGKNVGGPEPGTSPVGAGLGTGPGVLGSSIDLGAMGPSLGGLGPAVSDGISSGGLGPSIDLGVIEPGSSVSGLGPAVPDGISSGALGTMEGNLGMPSVIGLDGTGLSLDIGSSPGVGGFDPSVGASGTGNAAVAAGAGLVVDGTGFVIKKSDEDENKKLKVKCVNGIGPDCVGITGGSSAGNVDSSVSVGGSGGITLAGVGEVKGMVDLASVGVDAGLNVGIGVADGSKIGDGLSGVDLNVDLGKVSGCVNGLGPGCGVPIIQGDTGAPVSVSVGGSSGPDAGIGGIVAKIKKEEDGDKSGKISLVFASGNASAIDNMLSSTSLGLGMQQQTSIINAADPSIQQPSIGSSADLLSPLSEPGKSDLTLLSKPSTSKSKGSKLLKKEEDGDGSGTSSSKGVLCINGLGPGCGVPIVSGSGDTLSSQPGSSLSGTGAQSPAPVPGGQAPSAPGSADPGLMAPSKSQGLPADILGLLGGGPSLPGITGPSSSSGGAGADTSSGGPGTSGPSIGGSMGGGPAPSSSAGGVGSGTSAGAPGSGSKAGAPGSGGSSSKSPGTKGNSSASVSSSSPTSGGSPKPKTSSGSPGVSPLATALSKPAPKAKKPNLAALCLLYLGAFIDGVGYAPYPGDCQKLVQCLYYNGKLNAVARECPMGMFWDQPLLLCRLPGDVPCFDDRCLVPGVLKYSRSGGCNSYFKCIEGISVPACCPKGYKYDEDEECKPVSGIADDVCDDDCDTPGDLDTLTSSSCPSMPDSENKYGYIVREFGGLRFRGCPDGTMYSSQLCRCQGNLNEPISSKYRKTCSPEFKMNFDDGFRDISDGGLSFEYNNIFRSNKACKFNGDGQIFIWGFTSRYLGKSFAIKLKVKPAKGAARRRPETIISNCGSHGEPSIEISIYKGRMRFKAKTTGSTKVVTASEMYKEDDWNEVTYYYNGKHFGGSCGKNTFTKIMGGNLEPRDNPLSIGSCGRSSFRGKIDDLEIFTACVPPDV